MLGKVDTTEVALAVSGEVNFVYVICVGGCVPLLKKSNAIVSMLTIMSVLAAVQKMSVLFRW